MRRLLPLLGFALLALAIVGGAWLYGHRDGPVELVHVPIPAAEFEAWRKALETTPRPTVEFDATARAAWEALHRAEVEVQAATEASGEAAGGAKAGLAEAPSVGALAAAWESTASNALQDATPELFVDLGRRLGLEFVDAFAALLETCATARLPVSRCLVAQADRPEVARYVALGGLFAEFAVRGGFAEVKDAVLVRRPGTEPMLVAVFLDNWVRAVRASHPAEGLLSPLEQAWLNRWRAEWQLDGNPDRRVAAALALRHIAGYPAELNAGVLRFHAGQFAEAAEHFGRATEPVAVHYRRLAESAAGTAH